MYSGGLYKLGLYLNGLYRGGLNIIATVPFIDKAVQWLTSVYQDTVSGLYYIKDAIGKRDGTVLKGGYIVADGTTNYLEFDDLTGITITDSAGTSTLAISGNTITMTAGTVEFVELSNGSYYPLDEQGDTRTVFDVVNGNHGTIQGTYDNSNTGTRQTSVGIESYNNKYGYNDGGTEKEDLILNGDFSDGTNNWDVLAGEFQVIDGQGICITNTLQSQVQQSFETVVGNTYKLYIDSLQGTDTGNTYRLGTTVGGTQYESIVNSNDYGSKEYTFVATSTTTYLQLRNGSSSAGGLTSIYDNISIEGIYASDVLIPASQTNTSLDAIDNTLLNKGQVRYDAQLVESNCLTFNGTNNLVDLTSLTSTLKVLDTGIIEFNYKNSTNLDSDSQVCLAITKKTGSSLSVGLLYFGNSGLGLTGGISFINYEAGVARYKMSCGSDFSCFSDNKQHKIKVIIDGINNRFEIDDVVYSVDNSNLQIVIGNKTSKYFLNVSDADDTKLGARTIDSVTDGYSSSNTCDFKIKTVDGEVISSVPLSSGAGAIAYDKVNGAEYAIDGTTAAIWNNKQNVFHESLLNGFDLWTNDTTGAELRVPFKTDGTSIKTNGDTITGYTWVSRNVGVNLSKFVHNDAETKILQPQAPALIQIANNFYYNNWYGLELVNSNKFEAVDDWLFDTAYWDISGGKATCNGTQTSPTNLYKNAILTAGKYYKTYIDVESVTSGALWIYPGGNSTVKMITEPGKYAIEQIVGGTNNSFYLQAQIGFAGVVNMVSVKEVGDYTPVGIEYEDIESDYQDLHIFFTWAWLVYSEIMTGDDLAKIYDYINDQILRDENGISITDENAVELTF